MSHRLRFSSHIIRDIEEVLTYTLNRFGPAKREAYKAAIRDTLAAIAHDPASLASRERSDIGERVRTYHLSTALKRARHLILYQIADEGIVKVGRLLHDSMDLRRHVPVEFDRD